MTDPFRIDSHKMIYHVERVADWLKGRWVCPIYLEIAPSGGCNHRCIFCALDYLAYKPVFLDKEVLKKALRQAGALGVKSVMFAGEGEPLLHPQAPDFILEARRSGLDVSVTTNGVLLNETVARRILPVLSWIRVSLNAGTPAGYAKVHRTKEEDFRTVLKNLRHAAGLKKKYRWPVTIGVQFLLIPENIAEALTLARELKKTGVDYLSIKPYSQHPLSKCRIKGNFSYQDHFSLEKSLRKISGGGFSVIFRAQTMERLSSGKDYDRCYGLPFWAYIAANGDVYACSAFLGKKEYRYGNIYKLGLSRVLKGARRKAILSRAENSMDVTGCREVCRLDKINSYLWELKNPGPHVNFI
ncbi:MAG: radical SAM protein [Candidatus Omnitrophota bacterium]